MKRQRGQAIILVLILLALGALVIVPALRYTITGLRSQRISEDALATQYSADSALEDALWLMLNGGLLSSLDPSNPIYEFQFDPKTSVDIKIPTIPLSVWTEEASYRAKVDVQPNWLQGQPSGTPTFTYIIRIDQQHWDLVNYGFELPPNMHYVPESAKAQGPDKYAELNRDSHISSDGTQFCQCSYPDNPSHNWVPLSAFSDTYLTISSGTEGREALAWVPPAEWTNLSGRRVFIETIQVTGNPGYGVHYVEPSFNMTGDITLSVGPTGALGVAMYNILIDIEGVTYQVVVAYDSTTGEMEIISYQIVE